MSSCPRLGTEPAPRLIDPWYEPVTTASPVPLTAIELPCAVLLLGRPLDHWCAPLAPASFTTKGVRSVGEPAIEAPPKFTVPWNQPVRNALPLPSTASAVAT